MTTPAVTGKKKGRDPETPDHKTKKKPGECISGLFENVVCNRILAVRHIAAASGFRPAYWLSPYRRLKNYFRSAMNILAQPLSQIDKESPD